MESVARLLRSLDSSAADIAEVSRVSLDRVRAIMEGAPAVLSEIRALARGLRLPMHAFAEGVRPADKADDVGLLFRGALNETPSGQRAALDFVAGFVKAALHVLPRRGRRESWIERLCPEEQTFQEAHRLAHEFRSIFIPDRHLDPLTDLSGLLSEVGSVVFGSLQKSRFEGASIAASGYAFIFMSRRFPGRMLFTLAHELGHLLAHHGQEGAAVFDSATSIGAWRPRTRNEQFVDAFASVLLLPDQGIARALKVIRELLGIKSGDVGDVQILYLARYFGVSFDVAARRCEQLELLPQGGAMSLSEALRRDFKSAEQRADQLGLPQRPHILVPKVSDNLLRPLMERIKSGDVSSGWAAERLGLTINELFDAHARFAREHRP